MYLESPRLQQALELTRELVGLLLDAEVAEQDAVWIVRSTMVAEALQRARGNRIKAAKLLNITPAALDFELREFSLHPVQKEVERLSKMQLKLFPGRKTAEISSPAHKIFSTLPHLLAERIA